ncbi:MAG: hypothetical protein ACOYXB_17900 [Bacteroidota bacterium]
MKTNILIAAMLTTALTVSAQSAHRTTNPDVKRTASTETKTVRSSAPARQTTVSTSRSTAPAHTQSQSVSKARTPENRTVQVDRSRTVEQERNQRTSVQREAEKRNVEPQRNTHSGNSYSAPRQQVQSRTNQVSQARSANQTVHTGKTFVDPKPGEHVGNRPVDNHNDWHRVYVNSKSKHYYHNDTRMHDYRVVYYPRYHDVFWTRGMHRMYLSYYPYYTGWHYNYGYRIQTISSFDAAFNIGEVARVYGRVYSTWYNSETDDYLLFFGGEYPYQHLTVIVPGNVARRYSWRPEKYFLGQHVVMTGLITSFEGKPEMEIRSKSQFRVY